MSDDETIVIALRVADARATDVVAGSVQTACGGCRVAVWLAPTSQRVAPDTVLCWSCYRARADLRDVPVDLAPGVHREVNEHEHRN